MNAAASQKKRGATGRNTPSTARCSGRSTFAVGSKGTRSTSIPVEAATSRKKTVKGNLGSEQPPTARVKYASNTPTRTWKCHAAPGVKKGARIQDGLLLHRVSSGNPEAINECIARFGGLVWSLARRSGLPDSELEDAVHEIFTELWQNGHKYDPTIASEAAFVAIIARRRLIDRRRRINRRPTFAEINENSGYAPPTQSVRPELIEEAAVASKALETLSVEQQRVLRLSVYEGLSHELISRATGLPLGTVKTHARRGLIRLREMLKDSPSAGGDSPTSAVFDSQGGGK